MDLTGGMALTEDEVTTTVPPTPEYREGTSMWIWDDEGRVGLPRIAVEALGATWDTARNASVNVALPDGRVLVVREDAAPHPVAWFVLNVEANVEVDITALDALDDLRAELVRRGIVFALARVKRDLLDDLEAFGLTASVGADRLFPTLPTAVEAYQRWQRESIDPG